nr:stage II sporulation protein P [Paenibacillus bovis]
MIKIAARSSLLIISIFCLVAIIAVSSVRISFFSFLGNDISRTDSLLYMMSMENRSLEPIIPNKMDSSLSKNALRLFTNINLVDLKTYLISEIPGLDAATPKILIAGEGTDFTNLPIESPPPKDLDIWGDDIDNKDDDEKVDDKKQETKDYKVYIYHSHDTESFLPMLPGVEKPNHAIHKDKNITILGERLGKKLEEKGIKTLVEKSSVQKELAQKGMSYGQSYSVSRNLVIEATKQNKQIDLIFDLHRDSARKNVTTKTIDGEKFARVMFVVGTGHQNFSKNLAFADNLHQMLQEKYPGLSRGAIEKARKGGNNGIYNQDLSSNSLVIEIGGIDNTLEELNRTVDALADVISEYYWGDAVETSK